MAKKKEVKEKTKEEIKLEILESKIDIAKTGFDRYVNTLVRSAFIESCTGGDYFNKLFLDLMKHGHKVVEKSNHPEKEKIKTKWFGEMMFGKEQNEKESLEGDLEYWKRLKDIAKDDLKNLDEGLKKKIVIDSIKQKALWLRQFNLNDKLYEKLKDKPKVKKK